MDEKKMEEQEQGVPEVDDVVPEDVNSSEGGDHAIPEEEESEDDDVG